MPRNRTKTSNRCNYSIDSMQNAIEAVKTGRMSQSVAANHFGVPRGTLAKKLTGHSSATSHGAGRPTELSLETEQKLVIYLKACANAGSGLTKVDLLDLVHEYCEKESIETRWNNNRPGNDWFALFLKRHSDLSVRKGEALSLKRLKSADPFIVHKFFDDLQDIYAKESIDDPNLIYNCDETSFHHDPRDVKVVAQKGKKKISQNIVGSGKETTTVLACGNASGGLLPPFIVFKGAYMMKDWFSEHEEVYPGTAIAVSANGWMDTTVFTKWFTQVFLRNVPSKETRNGKKIILYFDGYRSHVNYDIAKAALENDVILIKFPPNLTHLLQPLDRTCFRPLKQAWNVVLATHQKNHSERLHKHMFMRLLGRVWSKSFKKDHLESGFKTTGLFPLNRKMFPEEEFDPNSLNRYKHRQNGGVPDAQEQATTITAGSSKATDENDSITSTVLPEYDAPVAEETAGCSIENSFENFIKEKIYTSLKQKKNNATQPKTKNSRVAEYGEILTHADVLKKLEIQEQIKNKKQKQQKKRKNNSKKRKREPTPETSTDNETEPEYIDSSDDLNVLEEENELDNQIIEVDNVHQEKCVENRFQLPASSLHLNKYYSVFYDDKWYLGQITSFADEQNTMAYMKFLKEFQPGVFKWPKRADESIVAREYIFYGPVELAGEGPFTTDQMQLISIKYRTMKKYIT